MIYSKELRIKLGIVDQRTLRKYALALNIVPIKGGYNNSEQLYTEDEALEIQELHDFLQGSGNTIKQFLLQKENEKLRLELFVVSTKETIEQIEGELIYA